MCGCIIIVIIVMRKMQILQFVLLPQIESVVVRATGYEFMRTECCLRAKIVKFSEWLCDGQTPNSWPVVSFEFLGRAAGLRSTYFRPRKSY